MSPTLSWPAIAGSAANTAVQSHGHQTTYGAASRSGAVSRLVSVTAVVAVERRRLAEQALRVLCDRRVRDRPAAGRLHVVDDLPADTPAAAASSERASEPLKTARPLSVECAPPQRSSCGPRAVPCDTIAASRCPVLLACVWARPGGGRSCCTASCRKESDACVSASAEPFVCVSAGSAVPTSIASSTCARLAGWRASANGPSADAERANRP